MYHTSDWLRRKWVQAGQSVARVLFFVCLVGLAAMLGAAQMGLGRPSPVPPTPQSGVVVQVTETVPSTRVPTLTKSPPPTQTPTPSRPTETPTPLPPTLTPTPVIPRIGIVAGHWWLDDSGQQTLDVGAVCDEGTALELREVDVNKEIAERVVFELRRAGYEADLLQEWDARLPGYRADVLVSIHADACSYPEATGFKVARVVDSRVPEIEDRLVACLVDAYGRRTGLPFHEGSITHDMTQYHTFYEIDPDTPGAIIETGFMGADRWLLTQRPDLVAQGIIDGILCFLEGEGKAQP